MKNSGESDNFRKRKFLGLIDTSAYISKNFSSEDCIRAVKNLRKSRQKRAIFYPEILFGEPGWDILLDIYQAEMEGRATTIKAASLASNVSDTSALRWICILEKHGLLIRTCRHNQSRRFYLRTTPKAFSSMSMYIASL